MKVQSHQPPVMPRLSAPTPGAAQQTPEGPTDRFQASAQPPAAPAKDSKLKSILGSAGVLATSAAAGIAAGTVGAMGGAVGATAGAVAGAVLGVTAAAGVGAALFVSIAKESPLLALALIIAAPVTVGIFAPVLWAGGAAGMAAVGAVGAAGGPIAAALVGAGGAVAGAALASSAKAAFQ